jgi:hypothetical protein
MGTTTAQLVVWLGYGLEYGGTGIRVPKEKIGFYLLRSVQTNSTSYTPVTRGVWTRIRWSEREAGYKLKALLICHHVTAQEYPSLWKISQRCTGAYSYWQEAKKKKLSVYKYVAKNIYQNVHKISAHFWLSSRYTYCLSQNSSNKRGNTANVDVTNGNFPGERRQRMWWCDYYYYYYYYYYYWTDIEL